MAKGIQTRNVRTTYDYRLIDLRGRKFMIVEMRTYKTKPSLREEFLSIFKTKSIPAHREIGMKIMSPFPSLEDADVFFFMRTFPNLESREPMKAKFYERE